ncbi:hypothetical protein [Rhizobium sp. BR 314]|uniref:hypothetical protein n=1 Tax=Rhizobium sp. BR 314 TaxID=3040013 RepID=UPI0039BFA0EE
MTISSVEPIGPEGMSPSMPQGPARSQRSPKQRRIRMRKEKTANACKDRHYCGRLAKDIERGDEAMTMHAVAFFFEYSFDELSISLCDRWESGLLLYGYAELTSAGADYDDEFYVSAIRLDGGARLTRPNNHAIASNFEIELFRRIAAVIEDDKTHPGRHTAELFADELEQFRETDSNRSDRMQRQQHLEASA